ncbi:MAG: methionine--tRNA ligase [Pseudomonadota bacterium]
MYVTTPIFYANDKPHIGHSYTVVIADIISRYYKNMNYKVYLSTGTDEHGIKVQKSALTNSHINTNDGLTIRFDVIQKYVSKMSNNFHAMMMDMHIEYDNFIRTSDVAHKNFVIQFWNKLYKNDYIYLSKYSGWYSERDESFIKESDLVNSKAPSGGEVKWVSENVHFFKLSMFQDRLLEYYNNNPNVIMPHSRLNEVKAYIQGGLRDLCVSRTGIDWGVKVPGYNQHTIYVWIDALANYLSSIKFDLNNIDSNEFWPCDIHIIGKDILIFHAVYWPALLMALDLPLPKCILAHGWWLRDNDKMSKSIGNTLSHTVLLDNFSSDVVRYCMIKEMNIGNDGNISYEMFENRYSADLVNKVGNLVQRVLVFIEKKLDKQVPYCRDAFIVSDMNIYLFNQMKVYHEKMQKFDIHRALIVVIDTVVYCNIYLNNNPVWNKDNRNTDLVLYSLVIAIYYIAIMLRPFMPDTSNAILDMLNISNFSMYNEAEQLFNDKHKINKPYMLFPRL